LLSEYEEKYELNLSEVDSSESEKSNIEFGDGDS
jgi:hypothetical protein